MNCQNLVFRLCNSVVFLILLTILSFSVLAHILAYLVLPIYIHFQEYTCFMQSGCCASASSPRITPLFTPLLMLMGEMRHTSRLSSAKQVHSRHETEI